MIENEAGLRHGVQVCKHPTKPNMLYIRVMYHEWFWGPFKTEQDVLDAMIKLDEKDPYWDYDCFSIHYGADPLPDNYVTGFNFLSQESIDKLEKEREKSEWFQKN